MSQRAPGAPLTPNAPQSAWRVTGQQEVPGPGPDGRLVDGWKVSFVTALGVNGSLFLPKALYNVANVRAAVAAAAYELDQVHQLQG